MSNKKGKAVALEVNEPNKLMKKNKKVAEPEPKVCRRSERISSIPKSPFAQSSSVPSSSATRKRKSKEDNSDIDATYSVVKKPLRKKKGPVEEGSIVLSRGVPSRTNPFSFSQTIISLTPGQKETLVAAGFGCVLDYQLNKLDRHLAYYLCENLNADSLTLKLGDASVVVTSQLVHDILGIPIGVNDFECLATSKTEELDFQKWKEDVGLQQVSSIRPSHLVQVLLNMKDNGHHFLITFMIWFVSQLIVCDQSGNCVVALTKSMIGRLNKEVSFRDVDWCSFVLNQLKECQKGYNLAIPNTDYYFKGPMIFLQLLYVDSTNFGEFCVARRRPAISGWNTLTFKKRLNKELEVKGSFGKLGLMPAFDPEVEEEGLAVREAARENVASTSAPTKEAYLLQLENVLTQGLDKFADDDKLSQLYNIFRQFYPSEVQVPVVGKDGTTNGGDGVEDGGCDGEDGQEDGGEDGGFAVEDGAEDGGDDLDVDKYGGEDGGFAVEDSGDGGDDVTNTNPSATTVSPVKDSQPKDKTQIDSQPRLSHVPVPPVRTRKISERITLNCLSRKVDGPGESSNNAIILD